MALSTALIIGLAVAVVATAIAYIFIMPAKKREYLPPFFKFLHDLFNLKNLWAEKIIKILYVFMTLAAVIIGILLLFSPNLIIGLVVLIAGPIVIRVIYELIMLRILEVQNVISINRKLKK